MDGDGIEKVGVCIRCAIGTSDSDRERRRTKR
jgi:hypothetical protein